MDLRTYSIPVDIGTILDDQLNHGVTWYQPFIFTDNVIAGTAAIWNAGEDRYLCTEKDSPATRANFMRETRILSEWYSRLTDIMVAAFPGGQSYLDFGCNIGHFGVDLSMRGKKYTGIDGARLLPGVELLRQITGVDFEYAATVYNENIHRLDQFDETRRFDVGILSVVIMHLTDPHYAMPYFASKVRQGIFFSSNLTGGSGHLFRARITKHNRNVALPHTFELVPTEPLCETMMRLSGFPHVYKIPHRPGLDPNHARVWAAG